MLERAYYYSNTSKFSLWGGSSMKDHYARYGSICKIMCHLKRTLLRTKKQTLNHRNFVLITRKLIFLNTLVSTSRIDVCNLW